MATTKTYTTKEGGTFEIGALVQTRITAAGRQLKREGIVTELGSTDLESSPQVAAEMARVCIVRWTLPTGEEPLAGLGAKAARELIASEPGLVEFVMTKAREITTEAASRFEVVSGN